MKRTDEMAKRFPLDTTINRHLNTIIQASIEIHLANSAKAIDLLEPAAAYDLARPLVALYPPYVRGQAYLLLEARPTSCSRVSENSRPSMHCVERSDRRTRPSPARQRVCDGR